MVYFGVFFFICSVMLTFFQSSTFDFFLALISRTKYSLDIPHARSPLDWRAFSIYAIGAFSCQSQPSVGCYPQAPPSCSLSPPTYLILGAVAWWRPMLQQWWAVERALVSFSLYTNTITEARRVISTGKEETVLQNDTVVSIVNFFLRSVCYSFLALNPAIFVWLSKAH